jgi:hypothetical protein
LSSEIGSRRSWLMSGIVSPVSVAVFTSVTPSA